MNQLARDRAANQMQSQSPFFTPARCSLPSQLLAKGLCISLSVTLTEQKAVPEVLGGLGCVHRNHGPSP